MGTKKWSLFEAYGIELEYMIVDKENLQIRPIADIVLKEVNGEISSDYENGEITWSNELVLHVIELKTTYPNGNLHTLAPLFHKNVEQINQILEKHNAQLMPGAMHPFMNPETQTKLWPHDYNAVYALYNSIFNCKGHGWSNLQSTHINLPFKDNTEFEKLHAAIRILLPIIPALSASSPIVEGNNTHFKDYRLEVYRKNQAKIPSLSGKIIPERAFSKEEYFDLIFSRVKQDIAPYDKDRILDHHFLNSRGAIARFDRGSIEIRIIDIQECPLADLAISETIILTLKHLVEEKWCSLGEQKKWVEDDLLNIFLQVIKTGEDTMLENKQYAQLFNIKKTKIKAKDVWSTIWKDIENDYSSREVASAAKVIIDTGTLSTRILKYISNDFSIANVYACYNALISCLKENKIFMP